MVVVIGLTGGIASGKSTVSNMLRQKGFAIVDADLAARVVVEPGMPAYNQIIEVFGEEILAEDGTINRAKLGGIVFHDESQRMKLNHIVHPAVRKHMIAEKEEAVEAGRRTVIMDIPLLFESKLTWMVEKTIVVYVDEKTQLARLMARNNLSEED
ncbi:MAG TPA: dephospho-CoA kinase, partial [Chondromyces sp.]|nr:dephospho-CoA kinase [Chondromyces sp.]